MAAGNKLDILCGGAGLAAVGLEAERQPAVRFGNANVLTVLGSGMTGVDGRDREDSHESAQGNGFQQVFVTQDAFHQSGVILNGETCKSAPTDYETVRLRSIL